MNYYILGSRIRETRRSLGLSQFELAEDASISVTYLSYIENGKKSLSLDTLVRIATALNTTVDYLLIGNQANNLQLSEYDLLLDDCTQMERDILYEATASFKNIIKDKLSED